MDIYAQIVEKIIEQQESLIGPVAIQQAEQVSGIELNWGEHQVTVNGDKLSTIDNLVSQYETLFGQTAVEVCKEATAKLALQLTPEQLPQSLR